MNNANTFSKFSMIFGVCSILLASSVMFGIIAGGLAIVFAVLSKGGDLKMPKVSRTGFYIGLIGMLASVAVAVNTVYMFETDASFRKQMNDEFKQVYGKTLDEYLDSSVKTYFRD